MAKTNPTSATPEVIKIEVDQFHRVAMERKKDLKMEMEMLARERDLLKKEVGLTEKMQKYLELQKCGTEEKLERSKKRCEELEESVGRNERRCEELEAKVNKLRQKLSRSRRKCEELRRKEIEAKSRYEETNWGVDGGDRGIFLEKEPRNGETKIDQVLNVNHTSDKSVADAEEDEETLNVPEMDEDGKWKANAGDGDAFSPEVCGNSDKSGGNRGIELSTEAAATAMETPNVPESDENGKQKVNLGDGDGDAFSPEVCGTSDKSGGNRGIELSTEGGKDGIGVASSKEFIAAMNEVENKYKNANTPREHVEDAEALLGLTSQVAESARSLSREGVTPAEFVSSLIRRFGQKKRSKDPSKNSYDVSWELIGSSVSSMFTSGSGCRTMIGPLEDKLKQRKPTVRAERTRSEKRTLPDELESEAELATETDRNIHLMFEILKRKKKVELERLILNRSSFAQTIENLFALSFLVKDGRVEIKLDDDGAQVVAPRNGPSTEEISTGAVENCQFMFRFDFNDWKLMKDVVPDGEELMSPRDAFDM